MRVQSGWISTISYNTEGFLKNKLEELYSKHWISDFMFIWHYPEEDEKKGHFHVLMKVNKRMDTMDIQEEFKELSPDQVKPLKCIDFRRTHSVDDWILYEMHYKTYLATKGESRKYTYNKEDFRFCDEDSFEYLYYHAFHGSEWAQRIQIMNVIKENIDNPAELLFNNLVSIKDANNVRALQQMCRTFRNGRPNHEVE